MSKEREQFLPVLTGVGIVLSLLIVLPAYGEETESPRSDWHYGAYLDLSYALDFNFPENNRWRSKSTTTHVNELAPNMVLGYVWKDATPHSRWGLEFGLQDGYDTDRLVPQPSSAGDKPIDGADTLRHLSRANVSYLAPVGNGLTVTAGLFNSYIGYQSFYSKYNLNYTRSYMADNAPYFMFGLAARYPVDDALTLGLYVINGYSYLSHPNDQPSYGTQVVWKPASRWTLTENLYYGPDQSDTALKFWRFFSDSIVEWKGDHLTLALAYDIGTENAADQPGSPRTFWTGGAFFAHWNVIGPWSVAVRPEFYWDRNGRITGSEQLLKAVTATIEHRSQIASLRTLLRLEYRYDESTGPGGGFFKGGEIAPGVIGLTRDQQLLLFSAVWSLDH
ncbi:MAG: outer membrane beta-barrel protein [Nitrospiraceae bacterium]